MSATLEGEPPVDLGTKSPGLRGEPDKYTAIANNRFSRSAGEGGRHGRLRGTGPGLNAFQIKSHGSCEP